MPNTRATDRRVAWLLGVLSILVQIPFLERGVSLMDEGSILTIADGLRQGEVLYRDRVTFMAPLTYELMAFLLTWFGPHVLVGRVAQMFVFTGCVILLHAILRRTSGRRAALVGAILLLALKPLAFPLWTVVNYSQIGMLLCLLTVWTVLRFLHGRGAGWLVATGAAIGLTLVTKQNLGMVIGAVVALSITLDWLYDSRRRLGQLTARAGGLVLGVLPPIIATLLLYLSAGAATALVQRAVLGLPQLALAYSIPPPGLELWAFRAEGVGEQAFRYFPAPLFNLGWQGIVPLFSDPLTLLVELLVKTAYYAPVVLLVARAVSLARALRLGAARDQWSGELLVLAFGAAVYASMLYRADWAHLMNAYPALIVSCVAALAPWASRSLWGKGVAGTLCTLWLLSAVATGVALFMAYGTPVQTARGRLLEAPLQADKVNRVLAYLEQQPDDARILILRGEPFYYFASGRRVPVEFDMLIPVVVTPADDKRVAERLVDIDQIVYNLREYPLIPSPIVEHAPRTASVLANDFRITRELSQAALILKPRSPAFPTEAVVRDLWDSLGELDDASDRFVRESWAMFRVIAVRQDTGGGRICLRVSHAVGANEVISANPVVRQLTWGAKTISIAKRTFEIDVRDVSGAKHVTRVEDRSAGWPQDPMRVPLAAFQGRLVEIRLCANAPAKFATVGWAEPRILRLADR